MRIALPNDNWWRTACGVTGDQAVLLPPIDPHTTHPYKPDLHARASIGPRWLARLERGDFDLILDNGAAGLAFVPDGGNTSTAGLLHERAGLVLASHWIDPMVTVFQSLPWDVVWRCLESETWVKFVWDRRQCDELRQFGVPAVHYLPMAAPDRDYVTDPLDPNAVEHAVSFVGGQNTSCFLPDRSVPPDRLYAGTLAQAVRADRPDLSFFDVYYHLHQLDDPPRATDDLETRAARASRYFADKLYYNASQCIKQRDRFVVFLKRKLADSFTLIGRGWDRAYQLPAQPPLPTPEAYFDHFRKTAVNLNLVNGNSDVALNMRHFEITAAGGFMLCNHQAELQEYFEIGAECDTFRNEQELLDKIQYYLEHPRRRLDMARAGQRRTLDHHLYSHRLASIRPVLTQAVQQSRAVFTTSQSA